MSETSIALNRFGYGLLRGESPPRDARRYLRAQMDAFDPAPPLVSTRPDLSAKPGEIMELIRRLRRERQDSQDAGDAMSMDGMEGRGRRNAMYEGTALEGLPPEFQQSFLRAAQHLRRDVGLRTNIAVNSETPFIERLVHFWSNHFSVSAQKPGTHYQVANHEFDAIRPNVLGRFPDLLKDAVLHPAMLLYLDQWRSVGPGSRSEQARRRRMRENQRERGLNENLAREILELHTLGVDGGYSQSDVTEFAHALTGWTIGGLRRAERFTTDMPNGAAYISVAHEPGDRTIMGRRYEDTGAQQAVAVLDDLATHPATARFVCTKLARHFAGDMPPETLVARLETDFLRTGGDLASLTATLIDAPEMWTAQPVKFRAPFEWLVSTLRLTGVRDLDPRRIAGGLDEIGQMPWRAPSPAGYDDIEGSWAGPDALYRRVELAERIAGGVPMTEGDDVLKHAENAFPGTLSDHTRTWLSRAESSNQALGLLLVSPEMMRR